ncbi:MAG TPA: polyprenyl synthetase family protein [Acidiphilium sp.]|nr:MAG: geranylgeranyl pyrophosphate synthase [Acidiphilium sp. 21-60-14]OYV91705.1 MAG: geranylgeranyl pyrophosphate synthase [Acidiphilium sp. 37-60-79]OZB38626.1 MAG: geranylgeranyl pyrophosphate synthase [Acidiphilium sp. 34-60-192]HQT87770.1 polyprenyl synthetase family protein [Acidiphilium sp.]HQU23585.1 polyprenyl synthetase family protein [Acidiphilium sp.]
MDALAIIEAELTGAMLRAEANGAPPKLAGAMRHALFPRGARVRPRLAIAVAAACGATEFAPAIAAGAALELLHCASLVHDDLPCFDDASLRRGKPSVHAAFGEPIAVLAGDALIVLAFQTLAHGCMTHQSRLAALTLITAQAVGMPSGIVAGQAWESEPDIDIARYQRAKTGALFAGAAMAGAAAAGHPADPWRGLGEALGDAYQVADDLCDAAGSLAESGKLPGRDAAKARPSMVRERGIEGALDYLDQLADAAAASIPACPGRAGLQALMIQEAKRLVPKSLARVAA